MTKTAMPNTSAANPHKSVETLNTETSPKSQFIGASLSMSWQLMVVVLVPIIGGVKLDQHLKTTPYLFIIGFIIAMLGSVFVIKKSFNEFNVKVTKKVTKK